MNSWLRLYYIPTRVLWIGVIVSQSIIVTCIGVIVRNSIMIELGIYTILAIIAGSVLYAVSLLVRFYVIEPLRVLWWEADANWQLFSLSILGAGVLIAFALLSK